MLRAIGSGFLLLGMFALGPLALQAAAPVVADLTPNGMTSSSVELTWTVSGGEPATVYDLRMSTAPITGANFANATVVGGLAAPTGGTESHTVSGLFPNTRYWFAVKGFAATGESAMSNVAEAMTLDSDVTFADSMPIAGASSLYSMAHGDFNRDGKLDLVFSVGSGGTGDIVFYPGDGAGGFGAPTTTTGVLGNYPLRPVAGDFTGDGILDLAVPNFSGNSVTLLAGDGAGGFTGVGTVSPVSEPHGVALADFDRDGDLDLVTALWGGHAAVVHLNDGVGTFTIKGSYGGYGDTNDRLTSPRAGDFDGDGILDLLVANFGTTQIGWGNTVGFMKGNGDGSFADAVGNTVGRQPSTICIGDLNGDGKLDFTVTHELGQMASVCLGSGDGTFAAAVDYPLGSDVYAAQLADLNGDGASDLLVARFGAGDLALLVGQGDGTFAAATAYSVGEAIRDAVVADFDRDGRPDAMALGAAQTNIHAALNTTPWPPAGSFRAAGTYASGGTGTHAVATGDFDRDGILDLVITNHWEHIVSTLAGAGDGTFGAAANHGVGSNPLDVMAADLNRDGKMDLASANHWSANASVLAGNGDGTFGAAANYGAGTVPTCVGTGDFNRDGIPDLAVGNRDSDNVSILIGQSDGTYLAAVNYAIGNGYHHVAIADFDRDGVLDLALSNSDDDNVAVLLGVGDGTFASATGFGSGGDFPRGVVAGDFNGDGKVDLAVANTNTSNVAVLLGDGTGSFAAAVTYAVDGTPVSLVAADFNRDGRLDLASGNYGSNTVAVLSGLGDGTFQVTSTPTAVTPHGLAVGDFDRDGRPDLVAACYDLNAAAILLNTASYAQPPPDGLVAWWRAEDNALDSVNGYHGTLLGGADFDNGWDGRAFNLDGASQAVAVPDGIIPSTARNFTVSAWVYANSLPGSHFIYYGGANAGEYILSQGDGIFSFSVDLQPSGWRSATSPSVSSADAWHLVTGVRRGTVIEIWVDGILQASTPIPDEDLAIATWNPTGFPSRIGAYHHDVAGNIYFWDGRIDEVKLFSRALSADEIAALAGVTPNGFRFAPRTGMPRSSQVVSDPVFAEGITASVPVSVTAGEYQVNGGGWTDVGGTVEPGDKVEVRLSTSANFATAVAATLTIGGVDGTFTATTASGDDPPADGLVAWWRAEDNALDSVGGHHGTLSGGTAYTDGQSGRAFEFDGIDGMVATPYEQAGVTAYTVSAWVKTDDSGDNRVFTQCRGAGAGMSLTLGMGSPFVGVGKPFIAVDASDVFIGIHANAVINDGKWHHVAGTWSASPGVAVNPSQFALYLDGMRVTELTPQETGTAVSPLTGSGGLDIGRHQAWNTFFNGLLDEVKIFDRALAEEEIGDLSGLVPDAFAFADLTGIHPHMLTASAPITVTGIRYPASISIADGEYEINDSGTWLSAPGTVAPGDTVRVQLMSSAAYGATVGATLTIGGVSDTFSVTTIEQHVVTFRTDGTEGATVNGAATVTQAVVDGEDCAPVTAAAPPGYDFLGWTGDYVGEENPLTLTNVTESMTVTANFAMEQVACGSVFELDAAAVGLDRFRQKPKVYATYEHPVTAKEGKASAKVLDKIDKEVGAPTLACEWTKKIKLYDAKAFKGAEKGGIGAAEWITPATMADLEMDLHLASKEIADVVVQPIALAVPVIDDVRLGEPDAKGNLTMVVVGRWFGTKPPKIWREYEVPGKAADTVVIKRQAMKVVKPTELNTDYRDSKGKPACMDPATGESQVIVIVPAKEPKGALNGTVVLDNGVGLAAGPDLSVGTAWVIGTDSGGGTAIFGTRNGGLSWLVQVPATAYPGHIGNDISAVDELTAWAALGEDGEGEGGIILHTVDGGTTWTAQDLPEAIPSGVKGIKGLSRDEAWAVGLAGPVLHTLDGGETWTVVPTPGITLVQVNRLDALGDDIWIADFGNGDQGMIHSADGGATWRRESLPDVAHAQGPMAVSIVDADTAWAGIRTQDGLHRTTDGGDTWRVDAPGITGPNDIDDVCAVAADRAWMVQNISGASAGLAMFVDIGSGVPVATSWHFPDYVYEGVAAVDARTAWITGFRTVGASAEIPRGSVRRTVNGVDWSQMPMPDPHVDLWKISVVGAGR